MCGFEKCPHRCQIRLQVRCKKNAGQAAVRLGNQASFFCRGCAQHFESFMLEALEELGKLGTGYILSAYVRVDYQNGEM